MPIAVHEFESALRESNRRPTEFHSESRSALELHGIAADQMHKSRESPLVIPCKFSAVINSARHSCTHLVARARSQTTKESRGYELNHSVARSGEECQSAPRPSVNPLVVGSSPTRGAIKSTTYTHS